MRSLLLFALALLPQQVFAQTGPGPFARIAVIRPAPGKEADFEAGYRRHLDWHRRNRDPWVWYGWTVVFGERVGWFIDGTFGRSAGSLDSAVAPQADGADNDLNVAPYGEWMANSIYEFLPALSGGSAEPPQTPLLELVTYDVEPGSAPAFEQAIAGGAATVTEGTWWFRLTAGGVAPRYLRMRGRSSLSEVANDASPGPDSALKMVRRMTIEMLRLRRDLSLGLETNP